MKIVGLTGGIGMGKTTVAGQLARLGAKVSDADAVVHRLLAEGGHAVQPVGKRFPEALVKHAIDRRKLGAIVFADPGKRAQLEAILHPLVRQEERRFVQRQRRLGAKLVVLDIPLLYETGADTRCDAVLVAAAPPFMQRRRVLRRPNMTEAKFAGIVRAQLPERVKRRRADAVIPTGLGRAVSFRAVARWVRANA